jgi:Tol biopolymer transport system component
MEAQIRTIHQQEPSAVRLRLLQVRALVEDIVPACNRTGSLSREQEANKPLSGSSVGRGSDMAINRGFGIRALTGGLLLLLFTCVLNGASSSGQIRSVAVSPDGKLLALDYERGSTSFIYKIAVDTGVATRLTDAKGGEESGPAFSPDGNRIAYTYWPPDHRRSRIVIINVDGSDLRQWSPSGVSDFSPVFSSDGKTIVFSRSGYYGSASPIAQPHPHAWDFYAANLDGTNVRRLTSESFYMTSPVSVSPDGKSIVVVTEGLYANRQIAVYSVEHPGPPTLTLRPHVPKEADHKNPILTYPNYASDGKSILFMAASNGRRGYDYDVYRVDLGTGSLERLTNGNGYATDLRVSADGKTAVFLKWHKSWLGELTSNEICLLDLQNRKVTPLKVSGLN